MKAVEMFASFLQNGNSGRESAPSSGKFEPTHVDCYGVLKLPLAIVLLVIAVVGIQNAEGASAADAIVCPREALVNVKLAAKELRRYVYLRTGKLLPLAQPDPGQLMRSYADACRYLIATVNTPGALAMVINMENHAGWGPTIAKHVKQSWPKEYQGQPRLIVPTVRSVVNKGESVRLKTIALDPQPVKSVSVLVRQLGGRKWKTIPARHLARAVFEARLPAARDDFEYHVTAETAGGQKMFWPATAPAMNQTVVIAD
jgi:hypothetical protein